MNDDDLKSRIVDLVDRTRSLDREDARQVIFDFVTQILNERAAPVRLSHADIEEIRDRAIGYSQSLSNPTYVDAQPLDDRQRVAFCYLEALVNFLRKRNLIKYLIESNTEQPRFISVFED